MRPVTQTIVGIANGDPVVVDYMQSPFQVSVGVVVVSGVVDYTLQYTYDASEDGYGGGTTWFDSTVMDNETTSTDAVINAAPVAAVRVINAGVGTIRVRIYQAGAQ